MVSRTTLWNRGLRVTWLLAMLLFLVALPWRMTALGQSSLDQSTATQLSAFPQDTTTYPVYLPLARLNHPPPPPVFGVIMGPITESGGLSWALYAGVHWVNFGAFDWPSIEPVRTSPPTYHWEVVDEQSLINASQEGLTVIARVHHTPTWAREIPGHNGSRIRRQNFDEFAQFLTALVNRYKRPPYNVKYWELDSEVDVDPSLIDPNNPIGFWCWGDEDDAYYGGGYFADMLKWAYPAIKAADSQATVAIGGLLLDCDPRNPPPGKDCKPSRFLEGILRGGGGPHLDIVSFHAYAYYQGTRGRIGNGNWTGGDWDVQSTAVMEKASFLQEVLDAYGYGDKGLMNTEVSLFCSENSSDCFETQAMYVPRAYAEALAFGLIAQTWYKMKEPSWRYEGLLYEDLTPKPVYYTYSAAVHFLADARYVGPVGGYPGIEGYAFVKRSENARLEVVWSADRNSHTLTVPDGATVYDKYGSSLSGDAISVGYSPVYIRWP